MLSGQVCLAKSSIWLLNESTVFALLVISAVTLENTSHYWVLCFKGDTALLGFYSWAKCKDKITTGP